MPRKKPTGLEIVQAPLKSLSEDPHNARTHDERNIGAIKASLTEFGQVLPLVVKGKRVIGGNGTLRAMRELGWESCSVVHVDHLTADQASALAIALNRSAELAGWDENVLADTLRKLRESTVNLDAVGFSADEIESLVAAALPPNSEQSGAGGGGSSGSEPAPLEDVFEILITCRDEEQQIELLERFENEGLKCRALTA